MVTLAARINHARVFSQFHLTFNWLSRNHLLPTRLTAFQTTRGMLSWESEVCLDYFFFNMTGNANLTLDQRKWKCREFWKTQNIEEVPRSVLYWFQYPATFKIHNKAQQGQIFHKHTYAHTYNSKFIFIFLSIIKLIFIVFGTLKQVVSKKKNNALCKCEKAFKM